MSQRASAVAATRTPQRTRGWLRKTPTAKRKRKINVPGGAKARKPPSSTRSAFLIRFIVRPGVFECRIPRRLTNPETRPRTARTDFPKTLPRDIKISRALFLCAVALPPCLTAALILKYGVDFPFEDQWSIARLFTEYK